MIETAVILDYLAASLIVLGALFTLAGSVGLLRLADPISRIHAPTLASTLGVGSLLMASIVHAFAMGAPSLHEVLVMAFLFVTTPVSAHFIGKVQIHRLRDRPEKPQPPTDKVWATQADT